MRRVAAVSWTRACAQVIRERPGSEGIAHVPRSVTNFDPAPGRWLAVAAGEFILREMCSIRLAALGLFAAHCVAAATQSPPSLQAAQAQPDLAALPATTTGELSAQPVLRLRPGAEVADVAAANRMFARLLDSVGLYTIIGGLKPMSDIMAWDNRLTYNLEEDRKRRADYDAALGAVESDTIKARVLWGTGNRGKSGGLFVFRTDLVRATILAHPQVFQPEDIAPNFPVEALMRRLETRAFSNLSRVQGLLYGFPPYAVDFFCNPHRSGQPIGIGQDRKGITIPCYAARSDFVYVIPIDNEPAPEDREIQSTAASILAEYRQRRPRYEQTNGELAALNLINDWYRDIAEGKSSVRLERPLATLATKSSSAKVGEASARPNVDRAVVSPMPTAELERLKISAQQGDASTQFRLGSMYSSGRGVPRDLRAAAEYYRMAAERGLARAQMFLGLAYLHGSGVTRDTAQGLQWLCRAAEQGHSGAYYYLGNAYAQGQGVAKDTAEAAKWYRLAAADTSDPLIIVPQYYLGNLYATGDGVPKDIAEAARWYRIAAERGHRAAQRALGRMYFKGDGVPKSAVEGLAWICVADGTAPEAIPQLSEVRQHSVSTEDIAQVQQRSRELAAEVYRNRGGRPSPPD
jgi:TPR repeat protein